MPPTAPSPKTRSKPRGFAFYEPLRSAYVEGRLKTLEDVARASGVSISTIEKKAGKEGWGEQRSAMEEKLREERDKASLKTKAAILAELDAQALKVAGFLIGKAIVTLDKKVLDPATGAMVQAPFNSESAAIQALAQGFRMQRVVAGLKADDPAEHPSDLPEDERALRQMSPAQLEKLYHEQEARIIEHPERHPQRIGGTKEGGS